MVELEDSTTSNLSVQEPTPNLPQCSFPLRTILDFERLKDLLENIPSGVVVVEKPDGKVIFANKRALELLGRNPCGLEIERHAVDLRILSLTGEVCKTQELPTYRALFKQETVRDIRLILERRDGTRFFVNASAKPLYDKDGKANVAIAIFDDVTERVKTENALKESEDRLNNAQRIAHLGNWEYYVNEDKAVWSEELFHIFGLTPNRYGPNREVYLNFIHPDDRKDMEQRMQRRQGITAADSFDYRIVRKDGSVRVIHTERRVREAGPDKRPLRVMGVEQDITERKQAEQKLAEYTKDLERLVEERTRQLKDAERMATIGQTAGMIGHDIRNPLQAIAGELFLMKQDVDASPDSECKRGVQESLATIQEQVDYMNKIIADLQDFARPLKPEFVDVDLCMVIPQLVITVTVPSNIEARAVCEGELPLIKLDLTFLKRILVNLATNAVQAMPNGGKLTIKASQQGDDIIITVKDNGIGIPESIKPKIFQPLMTTKARGQGFGLAVVKRLVEAMGGTISFESKLGEGTEFKMVFPKILEVAKLV